jgi:hypothetical protein
MSKPAGAGQEVKAALDAAHLHVVQRVVGQEPDHQATMPMASTWYTRAPKAWLRQDQVSSWGGFLTMGCEKGQRSKKKKAPALGRTSRISGSANRVGVHQAALVPQVVQAAWQVQRRFGAHVALEALAVVAGGLDGAGQPVLVQAQQLAGVFVAATQQAAAPRGRCWSSSGPHWPV